MKQNTSYDFDKLEELTVMLYVFSLALSTLSRKSWISVSVGIPCVESFEIPLILFYVRNESGIQ